jgi:truncated hemoglobin YjbI
MAPWCLCCVRTGARRNTDERSNAIISDLADFLEVDDETKARGHELWALLAPHADAVIERFYDKVRTRGISPHVTDAAIDRLKGKQKAHWAALFGGQFNDDYHNSVRRIGIKHRDITLNPMWYVAGYMTLKIAFTNVIAEAALPPITKGRLIKTLDKFAALDMAVAMSTYDAIVLD